MNDEGLERLRLAIVEQAVKDYRRYRSRKVIAEIERFFMSDWCDWLLLDSISGSEVLKLLKKEKL